MTNSPNYKRRLSQRPGSVDGFVVPIKTWDNKKSAQVKSPQVHRLQRPVMSAHSAVRPPRPITPVNVSVPVNQNQPTKSLLNTTLPALNLNTADNQSKKKHKNSTKKKIMLRSVLVVVAIFFVAGGWVGWKAIRNLDKVFHGNVITDANALFSSTTLKGESQGRVNILLAGDSADDPGHQGADLTDSIMIVSLDTKNNTAFMLSIPRDLWVNIPGDGHQKINAANTMTGFNESGYPSGGMGQLEEIIQNDFGIPIDYYGLIDYTAFKDSVDAVGGITVNIQSPDPRGLYDPNISKQDGGPLKIPNGLVNLNGQEALNLARARGDSPNSYGFPDSDFDRTQHQRQMLVALAQKAKTVGVITNPIKVGQLFDALGNNVKTDLNLSDVIRLIQLTKGMNNSNVQSLAISYGGANSLLTSYVSPSGEDALIPTAGLDNFSGIHQYYEKITSSNPIVKESANVVILNASDVTGLASREETVLENKGFNVTEIADASTTYPTSTIVDLSNGQDPASKQSLEQVFAGSATTTSTSSSAEAGEAIPYQSAPYNATFVVVLGTNWDNSQ